MIHDFLDYDTTEPIEADICIAGAGAAGIAIARHYIDTSLNVVLLEAGGFEYEDECQAIYQGRNVGRSYFDLDVSRVRYFGGSTNHWAGECAPLDPIDLEQKSWVPYSGWPISHATLEEWYPPAQDVIGLGAYNYDHVTAVAKETTYLDLADDKMAHKLWRFNHPPNRFGETYRAQLDAATNVEVWLHANLVDIETAEDGHHVTGFKIATLDGKTVPVLARHFVLALGGLENPRALLNAKATNPAGLGNDHDLVGRFFADHLNVVAGQLAVKNSGWQDAYDFQQLDIVRGQTRLRASPQAQATRRILNSAAHLGEKPTARNHSDGYKALRHIRDDVMRGQFPDELGKRIIDVTADLDGIWHGLVEHFFDQSIYIEFEGEQAPNPDSRVTLVDEHDALGLQRIQLDWRLSPIDRQSIDGLVQLIAEEFGRMKIGRVVLEDWLVDDGETWPDDYLGGNHHIGTTRMASLPTDGVVDANCKMFGVDNLFLAGSSVFPTSGAANPTLTIVALGLRLADHIERLASHRTLSTLRGTSRLPRPSKPVKSTANDN